MTRLSLLALAVFVAGCPEAGPTDPPATAVCLEEDDPGVTAWWSADECRAILFDCDEDEVMFGDDCGCGCQLESACVDPVDDQPTLYLDKPDCLAATFSCEPTETAFEDACGCGCLP